MGEPIGILHLGKYYPPEPGGMEVVVKSFAEATAGRFDNYCLVASKTGPTRVERSGGTTIHYLKERGTILLTPILPSLPQVLHRLRQERGFQVILLHYPNPMAIVALVLSLLFRRNKEKIVFWHHADVLLEEWWKRVLYSLLRPAEEFLFRRTDAFVTATPHHVACSDTFRRFADRTAIIPYAIPDPWFEVSDVDRSAAEKTRKRMGGGFLLFVGRLVPYKGLDTLLRAADRIPCRIAIIGTGPLEGILRKEIAARGLEEKVSLLGGVDDLRPYYLGCEFFVLPSVSLLEGFGIVQIEAMALGKPVVSSDLPSGVTYVNVHGETGLTFHVGDDASLVEACNRLLSDTVLRERLGENARRRTFEKFSYTAMRKAAVPFIQRLCGGNNMKYGGNTHRGTGSAITEIHRESGIEGTG
jgi:rhamnosyl/mannosyltransferase